MVRRWCEEASWTNEEKVFMVSTASNPKGKRMYAKGRVQPEKGRKLRA
ncbi:hypothetical protein SLEP1_g26559 [Rubroshorea leprosula]|uniref:Uncharacterized protein n=1 Tax=Rubroshorea leprosula TaxID=152421 RepID=A0AAV5JYN0_9ROSI|nr:hypothetical protein SLEP1_g26559 [Rubroshorea leprosula]